MAYTNLNDKANGTRLSRLLIDKGTEAMRQVFDNIHPPVTLAAVLKTKVTQLQRLRYKVINNLQWDALYPASGNPDSKTFDVTLLTILLRNICGLSTLATGWGTMPPDVDRSTEANIVRIKLFRNEVYAHVTKTEVEDTQFENLWQKISQALVDLGIPQREIDELKNCSLSTEEEIYAQQLQVWKLREDEYKESLDEVKGILQHGLDETQNAITDVLKKTEATETLMVKLSQISCEKRNGNEEILLKLAKHNFSGDVRSFGKSFHEGTREWLFKRLDDWFANQESRVMILTAGAGFGKSVFAAKVVQVFEKKGKLAACHFCKFNKSNLRNPYRMLESLASHVCDNVEGFKEELVQQLKRPHEVQHLSDAFDIYVNVPLQNLQPREPVLIVIDGLDESQADGKNELLELIAEEFSRLPEWVRILVTSRPEIPVKKKLSHLKPIEILPEDADNETDLHHYLKFSLPSLSYEWKYGGGPISLLVRKCQGSFLFAYHLQSELLKLDNLADLTAEQLENFLPGGIGSVYEMYFSRLEKELKTLNKQLDVFRLLEILVVARGPLPLSFITEVLGMSRMSRDSRSVKQIICKLNACLSTLLYVYDDLVTVFHKSVVDWLTSNGYEEHSYMVEGKDGDELLWRACEKEFKDIKDNVHDLKLTNAMKYSLDHAFSHLIAKKEGCSESDCDCEWVVDMIIVHVILVVYPGILFIFRSLEKLVYVSIEHLHVRHLKDEWKEIFQLSPCLSSRLRTKISWHLFVIQHFGEKNLSTSYLQAVINDSPDGCFSDEDKRTARLLLQKFTWCEKLKSCFQENKSHFFARSFPSSITCVSVSSNKQLVVVGQKDGTISLLELADLNELCKYTTGSSVPCCTFSPDNSLVLYGRLQSCFDVGAKKERQFFHNSTERFSSCSFSPSGQRLITASGSEFIKLWDITGQSLLASVCGGCPIDDCSFSESGLFIVGKGKIPTVIYMHETNEGNFAIWNAITLQRVDQRNAAFEKFAKEERTKKIICHVKCSVQPASEIIVCADKRDFDVYALPQPFPAARFRRYYDCIPFISNYQGSKCLFSLSRYLRPIEVYNLFHFTRIAVYNFPRVCCLFPYSYTDVAVVDQNWFLSHTTEQLLAFNTPPDELEQTAVVSCSFSPDGSLLASYASDGFISIWNVNQCRIVERFPLSITGLDGCWWSEGLLWIFHFVEHKPVLSQYPVGQQMKIKISAGKHHPLDATIEEVLTFSRGTVIFKCSNETNSVLEISDTGVKHVMSLSSRPQIKCAAVSPDGSCILTVCLGKFQIWRRSLKTLAEYEMWKEDKIMRSFDDSSPKYSCDVTTDGKLGLIYIQEVRDCLCTDTFISVDMRSGDIKILENSQCDGASCDIILSPFFFIMERMQAFVQICVRDIERNCEGSLLYRDYVFQNSKFHCDSNILAVPRRNGYIDFFRIHFPEQQGYI